MNESSALKLLISTVGLISLVSPGDRLTGFHS